jgi:hypothetical protein
MIFATEIDLIGDYLPSRISLPKGTTSHQWTRQSEADTTRDVDILILGSSLGQSIDVRNFQKFDLRAFNLSSGSQTPIQSNYLLDNYLESFQPRMVIWDVNPFTFTYTGIESTIDLIANCSDCGGMIEMLIRTNSTLAWASYFKRLVMKQFEDKNFSMPKETPLSKYIEGGYMEVFTKAPETPLETDITSYKPLMLQKNTFESLLSLLNSKSISVILVYSPKSKSFIENFQNQQEWFDYFNSLVENGAAEKFINLNDIFSQDSINRTHFYDLAHLTREGVSTYNRVIIDSLTSSLKQLN